MHAARLSCAVRSLRSKTPAAAPLVLDFQPSRRTFRSAPSGGLRSDDTNGANEDASSSDKPARSGANGKGDVDGVEPASQAQGDLFNRDTLKNGASSSGRSRAGASRSTGGLPPVTLPKWFVETAVILPERRASSVKTQHFIPLAEHIQGDDVSRGKEHPAVPDVTGLDKLDGDALHELLESAFKDVAWSRQDVLEAKTRLAEGGPPDLEARNANLVRFAAYHISALSKDLTAVEKLKQWFPDEQHIATSLAAMEATLSRSFAHLTSAGGTISETSSRITLGGSSEEDIIYKELLSTLRAEIIAYSPPPKVVRELKRPVTVLSVLNYRGPGVAAKIIDDVASDLGAQVVRLDASIISRVIGQYLGQSHYSSRGGVSMLGYAAADSNGRLITRLESKDVDNEQESQIISVTKLFPALADDRWEDLKMGHILEEIVRAPEIKRSKTSIDTPAEQPLIVHVHDYVELVMTPEGASIINKLRTIIDRKWQKGTKIVMLGSTSSHINSSSKWRDTLGDLGKDDCHVIPFQLSELRNAIRKTAWEQRDCLVDNINNLRSMLEAMTGEPVHPALNWEDDTDLRGLRDFLGRGIYEIHWIYRFATQILGSQDYRRQGLNEQVILDAFRNMTLSDSLWSSLHAKAKHDHFSTFISPGGVDSGHGLTKGSNRQRRLLDTGDFDDHEKKLLSGLVDADDINVTFKDVIAPPEVGESLLALTSLSLHRPEAFSYGVLARERIHGCLLYGPPGTGKTMMAKALAKQSEANMLEVSAASINDMWVGNSEKNVRALFSVARKLSPMVIFLDEAEALLGTRSTRTSRGGFHEALNQFLREWDGLTNSLNDSKTFIVVATNRPFDLDEAVLRRLPRRILVDLPLRPARLDILQSLLREEILDSSVSLERLATDTELYSGSDLKNLCVAAAMEAVKEELRAKNSHQGPDEFKFANKRVLTSGHFQKALKDISASISEDMESLKAIRKFDERYGDSRRQKKRNLMGFEVVPNQASSSDARVRRL